MATINFWNKRTGALLSRLDFGRSEDLDMPGVMEGLPQSPRSFSGAHAGLYHLTLST